MKIEDFGEKIGGAKKDLWKERNFLISDLDCLSDREAFKFCIKDKIWKKPDYKILCNDKTKLVAFCIKKLRDALPAKVKPTSNEDKNKFNRKLFVEFISLVRDISMQLESEEDIKEIFKKIFVDNGYYKNGWTTKVYENVSIKNKFVRAAYRIPRSLENLKRELIRIGFPDSLSLKNAFVVNELEKGKFFVCKNNKYYYKRVCETSFNSSEEAEEYIKNMKNKKDSVFQFQKPILKNAERKGPWQRNFEVSTDKFLEAFGFRGGEFGNYASYSERQLHMNYCFDALMDLAYVLNVSPNFLSLKREGEGSLGIAFGARGSGKALAHYESYKRVINITKVRGVGCLSHEWLHSLDDFIGSMCKNVANLPFASSYMQNSENLSPELVKLFRELVYSLKYNDKCGCKKQNRSDFWIESEKLDKGRKKAYFSSIYEMFARSFEAYVQDSLDEEGYISQYLVHSTHNMYYFDYKPYPEGKEREEINKKFKAFFIGLKEFLNIPDFDANEKLETHK